MLTKDTKKASKRTALRRIFCQIKGANLFRSVPLKTWIEGLVRLGGRVLGCVDQPVLQSLKSLGCNKERLGPRPPDSQKLAGSKGRRRGPGG